MDTDVLPVPSLRRLPIWLVTKRSFGYVWEHRALFVAPLAVVFIWFFCCNITQTHFAPDTPGDDMPPLATVLWSFGIGIAEAIIGAALAVGIHRSVLLGEVDRGVGMLRWNVDFRRYFLIVLTLVLITFGPILVAAVVATATVSDKSSDIYAIALCVALAIGLAWLPISFRFNLALPATALREVRTLQLSWRSTRGNIWRSLAVAVLTMLPFCIVEGLADGVFGVPANSGKTVGAAILSSQIAGMAISSLADAINATVYIVSLSLSYDVLVRGGGPLDRQP